MAKIQRLKISTDEKMSMLRGQPGHMPAAPVAADPIAPAPTPEPAPTPTPVAASPVAATSVTAEVPAAAPKAVAPRPTTPAVAATKKGRGRPPKAAAPEVAEGTTA